uniref:Uncharacterized protein n=1 Tax=Arundo donax TaxID=35708 RepID=A0A0A8Z6I2_ARUDO
MYKFKWYDFRCILKEDSVQSEFIQRNYA